MWNLELRRLEGIPFRSRSSELTGSAPLGKPEAKRATVKPAKEDAKIEGAALIGIDVRKELDFPNWYQQVLTKGDMVYCLFDHGNLR